MKRQSRCDLTNDFSDDALGRSNKDPEDPITMKKSTEMKKLSHEDLSYSNSQRKTYRDYSRRIQTLCETL